MSSLSLSLFYGFHDSSVTIADETTVLLHLEAERYFRRKHHRVANQNEMEELIRAALDYVGRDVDAIERLYIAKCGNPFCDPNAILCGRRFDAVFTGHHNNHIGAVLNHGFPDALIVVADGGSEDGTTKFYHQNHEGAITPVADLDGTAATGRFYAGLTMLVINPDFLAAHGWDAGKTMGLSAYGHYQPEFLARLPGDLPGMNRDIPLDVAAARKVFGISDDYGRPWCDARRKDLARTGQEYFCSFFIEQLLKYRNISDNLALVGGCALNVLLNSRILEAEVFEQVHIGPVSGDCGQSLGAILFHEPDAKYQGPFLGRGFGEVEEYPQRLVQDLLEERLVAWYQGRAEIGPRALGHRSLLGLPNSVEQRDRMNRVKGREPYRPVAPLIPQECMAEFFEPAIPSPYMTLAPRALEAAKQLAPAIVHADGTSRVQTLTSQSNPVLHRALVEIGEATGAPVLMNTSFNSAGEPIVDTPDDALRSFRHGGVDVLYVNGERHEK